MGHELTGRGVEDRELIFGVTKELLSEFRIHCLRRNPKKVRARIMEGLHQLNRLFVDDNPAPTIKANELFHASVYEVPDLISGGETNLVIHKGSLDEETLESNNFKLVYRVVIGKDSSLQVNMEGGYLTFLAGSAYHPPYKLQLHFGREQTDLGNLTSFSKKILQRIEQLNPTPIVPAPEVASLDVLRNPEIGLVAVEVNDPPQVFPAEASATSEEGSQVLNSSTESDSSDKSIEY